MKIAELNSEIAKAFHKYFPNSMIDVNFNGNSIYRIITFRCFLASSKAETINQIWENDIFHISFKIEGSMEREFPKGTTLDSDIESFVLSNYYKSYTTSPSNPYCVYGHRSIPFRMVKGDGKKIIVGIDKFFSALRDSLISDFNTGNIHPNYVKIVENKTLTLG